MHNLNKPKQDSLSIKDKQIYITRRISDDFKWKKKICDQFEILSIKAAEIKKLWQYFPS